MELRRSDMLVEKNIEINVYKAPQERHGTNDKCYVCQIPIHKYSFELYLRKEDKTLLQKM